MQKEYNSSQNFESLFKTYYPRLCYFAFQLLKDKQGAEDIVQESFVKYWNQRETVANHETAIKNFLYSTVRNSSLNNIRHSKVVKGYLSKLDADPQEDAAVLRSMIRSEMYAEIYKAVASLPASCQKISRMSYLEGMKNQEVADALGISINTVKTQKQRAMQLLRLKLDSEAFLFIVLIDLMEMPNYNFNLFHPF